MLVDLTDEERDVVIAAVRQTLHNDRYPRAPRLAPLWSVLAKLTPEPEAEPEPPPGD